MLSAVNSVKFASANNYKRTYTNTNQNTNQSAVGYQQSFGAARATKATSALLGAIMGVLSIVSPAKIAKAEVDEAAALAAKKVANTVSDCANGNFSNFVKSTLTPNSSFSHSALHPCLIEDAQETARRSVAEKGSRNFTYGFPDFEGHSFAFDYEDGKVTSYTIASSNGRMVKGVPTGYTGNFEQRKYKDVRGDGSFALMEKSSFRKDGSVSGFQVWEKSIPDAHASYDSVTSFPGSLSKAKIEHAKKANPAINNAQDGVFEFTTADNLRGNVEIRGGKMYSYEEIVPKADGKSVAHKYFDTNGNGAFEQYRIFYLDSSGRVEGAQTFNTEFDQDWIPYEKQILSN